MINRPNNWDNVQEFSERPKLPLGAYVCKVRKAVVQNSDHGQQLCILFDIAEGEYSGFYRKSWEADISEEKKWKGVLRQFLPREDGSEKDEWTKSSLKGLVTSFEKSNPGYRWNWDENSLAGKMIGIVFRNEEWEYDGKTGWTVRPFRAASVDSVRSGNFQLPKDKPLKNRASNPFGQQAASFAPAFPGSTPFDFGNSVDMSFRELPDDEGGLPF